MLQHKYIITRTILSERLNKGIIANFPNEYSDRRRSQESLKSQLLKRNEKTKEEDISRTVNYVNTISSSRISERK